MKRFLLSILALILIFIVQAQEKPQELQKDKKTGKFSIGLDYTYIQSDMKLNSLTMHSVWQGTDYGTDALSKDELNEINSYSSFKSTTNAVCVEAGMILLNKPGKKWYIDGNIILGLARTSYRNYSKTKAEDELIVKSDFTRPCVGIRFGFRYSFTRHWGIALSPLVSYTWGTSTGIGGMLYPPDPSLIESRKEKSISLYSRASLMVSYTYKTLTVAVGPGFYFVHNKREFVLNRTNPEDGSNYYDKITSMFNSKSFLDGFLSVEWRIIERLSVLAAGGIGSDYMFHAGARFKL